MGIRFLRVLAFCSRRACAPRIRVIRSYFVMNPSWGTCTRRCASGEGAGDQAARDRPLLHSPGRPAHGAFPPTNGLIDTIYPMSAARRGPTPPSRAPSPRVQPSRRSVLSGLGGLTKVFLRLSRLRRWIEDNLGCHQTPRALAAPAASGGLATGGPATALDSASQPTAHVPFRPAASTRRDCRDSNKCEA